MKTVTIRECAVRALARKGCGASLLLEICRQAMDGDESIDWNAGCFNYCMVDDLKPLYDALAPDIISSVREEPEPSNLLSQTLSVTHQPVYRSTTPTE